MRTGGSHFVLPALFLMKKSASQDKAALSSEGMKPIALFVVELCLAGGISEAGSGTGS